MLRTRVITALVLAPCVLAAVIWLPPLGFALLMTAITAAGIWEWAALAGFAGALARSAFVVLYASLAALVLSLGLEPYVLMAALGLWFVAVGLVLAYPSGSALLRSRAANAFAAQVMVLGALSALVTLRSLPDGALWLIWTFAIAWAADIGAYFAGRRFGRRRLAPQLSPGKTWEGAIGGAMLAILVAVPAGLSLGALALPTVVGLVLLLILLSVLGDLFESALKRSSGVKDSGGLLPGHGGMLDRIDSLLAILPPSAWILGRLV